MNIYSLLYVIIESALQAYRIIAILREFSEIPLVGILYRHEYGIQIYGNLYVANLRLPTVEPHGSYVVRHHFKLVYGENS